MCEEEKQVTKPLNSVKYNKTTNNEPVGNEKQNRKDDQNPSTPSK